LNSLSCGKQIPDGYRICNSCGSSLVSNVKGTNPPQPVWSSQGHTKKSGMSLWYLIPVLFEVFGGLGFIGGLIGYFIVKGKNRGRAIMLLIEGIVLSGIWFVVFHW